MLRNSNFLKLFIGRIVTNIGDSIYYIASMWLVYELGGNAFYTGLAGFLILLPKALQFLTGPFIDRCSIKKILVTTQILQCILVLFIPIAYLYDFLSIQLILIVMPLIAFIEEFAYPAQTKALPLILEKDDLINGNSLFAFAYQGVDIVFNAIAGILVAMFGVMVLYIADSITFAVATLCFGLLKVTQSPDSNQIKPPQKSIIGFVKIYLMEIKEGFKVVFGSLLWAILIGTLIANFSIGVAMAVLPSFADQIGGVKMYGIFLAALSIGSLIGALTGPLIGKFRLGYATIIAFTLGGICWTLSGITSIPLLSAILFGLAWIPIGSINVLFAGVAQAVIPNYLLGRVSSVISSVSVGVMPIGSLVGGYLAVSLGSKTIFSFTGIGMLCITIIWIIHPVLRRLPVINSINVETLKIKINEDNR